MVKYCKLFVQNYSCPPDDEQLFVLKHVEDNSVEINYSY